MAEQAIQGIAFDFGNTLCRYDEKEYWRVTDTTLEHIYACADNCDTSTARDAFRYFNDEELARKLPRLLENDLGRILCDTARELTGQELAYSEIQSLTEAHISVFVQTCKAEDGLADLLDRLSRRYRLAVLSNYPIPECIRLSLRNLEIDRYFHTTMVSGDFGVLKPSQQLFGSLVSAMALDPENVLFVGDNWAADVVGACTCGMPCVQIGDGAAVCGPESMEGVFGVCMRKAFKLPEFAGWRDARPLAVLKSIFELERWLEEQG